MKLTLSMLILAISLNILYGCGSSVPSNNPPDVSGTYACTSGCSGLCDFTESFDVSQDGSRIVTTAGCEGTINNNGDYNVKCPQTNCNGTFTENELIAHCSTTSIDCQEVVFTKQ